MDQTSGKDALCQEEGLSWVCYSGSSPEGLKVGQAIFIWTSWGVVSFKYKKRPMTQALDPKSY